LVRDARDATQILNYINQGVVFDEVPRCGGTLMQLAVRRGNVEVLTALLQQDLKRAGQIVSLEEFPIAGAPKKVPLILFAAYFAPNEYVIQVLQQANVDVTQVDEYGRNVLWYMEQNPVLRQTQLFDNMNMALLTSLGGTASNVGFQPALGQNQSGKPGAQQQVQNPNSASVPTQNAQQQPNAQQPENSNTPSKTEVVDMAK
jgi:hypothetical protein